MALAKVSRPGETPIRVLVLDDSESDTELTRHELARAGLSALTWRVDSEDAFASALEDFAPDIVLADHSLARFSAGAALELLRKVRPQTPLIIVTCAPLADEAVSYLRAGAEDLIVKENLGRLATAVTDAVHVRRPLDKLTKRQIEVLQLVAAGQRTKEIAFRLDVSVKTVEAHRSGIMKRLEIHDVASLVRYALRVGIVAMGVGEQGKSLVTHRVFPSSERTMKIVTLCASPTMTNQECP